MDITQLIGKYLPESIKPFAIKILHSNPRLRTWNIRRSLKHSDRVVDVNQSQSDDSYSHAKKRWVEAKPDLHLTWNKEIPGEPFVQKVLQYGVIESTKNILEIGPGWGRLLNGMVNLNVKFNEYYGVDISEQNIKYLKSKYSDSKFHFIHGDIESVNIGIMFDVVISSLTLKHLFPTFEKALHNISNQMRKGGIILFDLIEGDVAFYEEDGTYIHHYTRSQIEKIARSCNLELVGFDKVIHAPGFSRLLVIARK